VSDVWLIDRYDESREMRALRLALGIRGVTAEILDWKEITPIGAPPGLLRNGVPCHPPKAAFLESRVFTRHSEGDLALLYDWLEILEEAGTRLYNPLAALRRGRNKIRQAYSLARAGLPVPLTRAIRCTDDLERCLEDWGEVVIKPVFGHASLDVVHMRAGGPGAERGSRLGMREEIISWHLLRRHGLLVAQQYIENPGRDMRITVLGGEVASCVYHVSTAPDQTVRHFLYPLRWEKAPLTAEIANIAGKAVRTLGLEIAVLDMLEGPEGPIIIEVNCTGSIWARIEGTDMDLTSGGITAIIADRLVELVNGSMFNGAARLMTESTSST